MLNKNACRIDYNYTLVKVRKQAVFTDLYSYHSHITLTYILHPNT